MTRAFPGRSFAKERREVGDPVSAVPKKIRYIAPPPYTGDDPTLTKSIETVLPGLTKAARAAGRLVFHSVGDTGGIRGEETQMAVAEAMEAQINAAPADATPAFFYHLGDVIYFNGQSENYLSQFYEPYQYYPAPILAIPGNHDGDTQVHRGDQPDPEPSLTGFMENFCSAAADDGFKHRSAMDQPYCWWVLTAPFVTIIGLYTNVDGSLDEGNDQTQWQWLVDRLNAAPADKWLILALHHPCFSLDSAHGGYENTLQVVDAAFASAERIPDIVLSGHVHNYQRFMRTVDGVTVPYIIAGAGGYADSQRALHQLQRGLDVSDLPLQTTRDDVQFAACDTMNAGFLRLTATPTDLTVDHFAVPFPADISAESPRAVHTGHRAGRRHATQETAEEPAPAAGGDLPADTVTVTVPDGGTPKTA